MALRCIVLSCLLLLSGLWGGNVYAFGDGSLAPPKSQAAETEKVRQLIADGKYAEAEKLGKTLVEKNPNDMEANYQLGRAVFFQDRFAEAVVIFEKVAAALPKFAGNFRQAVRLMTASD